MRSEGSVWQGAGQIYEVLTASQPHSLLWEKGEPCIIGKHSSSCRIALSSESVHEYFNAKLLQGMKTSRDSKP